MGVMEITKDEMFFIWYLLVVFEAERHVSESSFVEEYMSLKEKVEKGIEKERQDHMNVLVYDKDSHGDCFEGE